MPFADRALPMDRRAVIDAAASLAIGEYDFFRLAYHRWWGHDGEDDALERLFVVYMFHHRVPHYVRHLARHVLALEEQGRLDPAALGARRYRLHRAPVVAPEHRISATLTAAAFAVILAIAWVTPAAGPERTAPAACSAAGAPTVTGPTCADAGAGDAQP